MDKPEGGILEREVFPLLAPGVRTTLKKSLSRGGSGFDKAGAWHEIRLGRGRPLMVVGARRDVFVAPDGGMAPQPFGALVVGDVDLQKTLELMSGSSLYAWEEEFRQGFLTLPGGHRVGLCGKMVMRNGRLQTLRDISSINVRVASEAPGAAAAVMPWLIDRGEPLSTLFFSPPGAGKTTILRDVARQLSAGRSDLDLRGLRVAIVDERSELAGMYRGRPSRSVGPRTDVLDGCPKATGMNMLLRSMAPEVIITDEIGRAEDAAAVGESLRCGVRVITSVHAGTFEELLSRPAVGELVRQGIFQRLVRLEKHSGKGVPVEVWDGRAHNRLHPGSRIGSAAAAAPSVEDLVAAAGWERTSGRGKRPC